MWTLKTHKICDRISIALILGIGIIFISYMSSISIIGRLCSIVITIILLKIFCFYLFQSLKVKLKTALKPKTKKNKVNQLIIEDKQLIYINDLKLQANNLFKVAIQSKKLNRAEVISIKDYLKNNIDDPTLTNKKYSNEAHCIYSYLKSEYINENTLNCVIKNIFIFANRKTA
ncbi:hypothetical protein [Clostridium perfringens]|uniref:hypothetical protein n=1 Tax=Clostridium perfringens TaxID=1502 RepID=UPI00096A2BEB|nr:hypothetical protein [Clostridium perfringens]